MSGGVVEFIAIGIGAGFGLGLLLDVMCFFWSLGKGATRAVFGARW